jgi:hypothetical protein
VPILLTYLTKPFVKYLVGAVGVALLLWFLVHKFHGYQESLRQEGREQAMAKVALIVRANDQNNRSLEQSLQSMLNQFGQRLDTSLATMDAKQRQSQQNIRTIIQSRPQVFRNPACNTPKDVIDERNRIRALGPK